MPFSDQRNPSGPRVLPRYALFIIACGLLSNAAHAIVNLEDLHLGTPSEGFSGEVKLWLSGASGNTDKSDTGLGARTQWQREKITDFLVLNYDYGRSAGETNTNKGFLHARHIYQWTPKVAWEGFGQLQHNEFTRLSLRALLGTGIRLTLAKKTLNKAALLGIGAFYEREDLKEKEGLTDGGTDNTGRASFYFVFKYQPKDYIKLLSTTYYQPKLRLISDYRATENATLSIDLTGRLALELSVAVAYDSQPPQTVERADVTYRTGLAYRF